MDSELGLNQPENSESGQEPTDPLLTRKFQELPPIEQRLSRIAIVHNLVSDLRTIFDPNQRKEFMKLSVTGIHEAGHARGVRRILGRLDNVKVFKNGSGVTTWRMGWMGSLHRHVRNLMYVGFLGKAAEEALGVTPHGHGFDMAQNDRHAKIYEIYTGSSGAAVKSEAASMASADAKADIDSLIVEGIKYGQEAA